MTIWDGINECYVPGSSLSIDPSLKLHTTVAPEIDPVTFEVIRSALWNVNEEAGEIIRRVSGSPIAQFSHDLNTVLFTEDAEFLYTGPYNLNLAVVVDLPVKWILENRSADPGIREGDIFMSNDPFVGASHVTDTIMAAPIFVDGELFAWTASSFHQYDMGGSSPGGYSPDAVDRFEEADPFPPVRIVEGDGEVRRDLLEWYLRKSRVPHLLELDFRSQIAGCNYATRRILALVESYGADVVKAAMRKIIDDGERAFADRLQVLPEGTWTARSYLESARPGDRSVYPIVLNVTKTDGRLVFDQQGTAPQNGVLSISYAAWRAGLIPPLARMLCDDSLYALGGALRRIECTPLAGSMMCASHPAATGNPGIGICAAGSLGTVALSRMLSVVEDDDQEIFAVAGTSIYPITALSGIDQRGNYFGTIHMEAMAGGLGAFRNADGEDTGGTLYDAIAVSPNIEYSEQYFPILYLYRRELADSGGAGFYRGGNSGSYAYIPHGTETVSHYTATSGMAIPTSTGLWGGLPGATNRDVLKRGTDVWSQLRDGRIPQSLDSISGGELEYVQPKERDIMQLPDDVWEQRWAAGGGYGDPLERDPEVVGEDVALELVTAGAARDLYGVVLDDNSVDVEATESLRSKLFADRLAGRDGEPRRATGEVILRLGPTLALHRDDADGQEVGCTKCGASFGPLQGWKSRALAIERSVEAVLPHAEPPSRYVDREVVLRHFCCPGCGRAVDSEVALGQEPFLDDISVDLD
jgi:N-methylhydantoinase B